MAFSVCLVLLLSIGFDDPQLPTFIQVYAPVLQSDEHQREHLFTGTSQECHSLILLLNKREISFSFTGGLLGGSICVPLHRWDEAASVARKSGLVVIRESLVEAARLYFDGNFCMAYEAAEADLTALDRYASASQHFLLMDNSRSRLAIQRDGLRLPSVADWERIEATKGRRDRLRLLVTMIPLAPGRVVENRVVPNCLDVLGNSSVGASCAGGDEKLVDPLLKIWEMNLEPKELPELYSALSKDWILIPQLQQSEAIVPALAPCTREFICNVINRSLGLTNAIGGDSLAQEDWLDTENVATLVKQKMNKGKR